METSPAPQLPPDKPISKPRKLLQTLWAKIKAFGVMALVISLGYGAVSWVEAGRPVVILDSVTIPKGLTDQGLTSEVLTVRIRERLRSIESITDPAYRDRFAAKSDPLEDQLSTPVGRKLPDIEIPGIKQHLFFMVETFRHLRDTDPVHLTADIVESPNQNGVTLSCRLNRRSEPQRGTPPRDLQQADISSLTQAIAECYSELANAYSLGLYLASERRFGDAISLSERMLLRPEDIDLVYERAHLLSAIVSADNLEYGDAEKQLDIATKLAPAVSSIHNDAGFVYLLEHKADHAEAEFSKAAQLDPELCGTASNLGASLYFQNKFEEARAVLSKEIAKRKPCAAAHINYATLLVHFRQVTEAEGEYKAAIEVDATSPDGHFAYSLFLNKQSRRIEAIEEMRRAVALSPTQARYHAYLGSLLHQWRDEPGANAEVELALSLEPNSAVSHDIRGVILMDNKKNAEAEYEFREASKFNPGDADAHYGLGLAFLLQHQFPSALEQFERAVALNPDSADCHAEIGQTLYLSGKLQSSVKEYEKALAIDPDEITAKIGMAAVWMSRANGGDNTYDPHDLPIHYIRPYCLDQASQLLTSALRLDPGNVDGIDASGILLSLKGQNTQALQAYRRAMDIDPSFSRPHIEAARIYISEQEFPAAVTELNRAIALDPQFAEPRRDLAELYVGQGQFEQARLILLSASQLDDTDGRTRFWLSKALFGLGKHEDAIEILRELVRTAPYIPESHDALAEMYQAIGKTGLASQERSTAGKLRANRH